jgi:hypothetical protein
MQNGANFGAFEILHRVRKLPCAYVAFECKNYSSDPANPELDQLAGRFSPNRGKIGFLLCRAISDLSLFVQRCRDTFKDDRGLIVPLEDGRILAHLELIGDRKRDHIDQHINSLIDEIWID